MKKIISKSNKFKIVASLFLIAIFSLHLTANQFKVRYTAGIVYASDVQGNQRRLLANGAVLTGEKVITKQNSYAVLGNTDGSLLKLTENSTIRIDENILDSKSRVLKVAVESGKLSSTISKLSKSSSVTFTTPTSVAGVRGTHFILEYVDGVTTLFLLDGTISFGSTPDSLVTVTGNQKATVKNDGSVEKTVMKEKEMTAATKGIPVRVVYNTETQELENADNAESDEAAQSVAAANELKAEILSSLQANRERMQETVNRTIEAKKWDIEASRSVGETLVKQEYRQIDKNTIRLRNVNTKSGSKLVTFYDLVTTFENGVPNFLDIIEQGNRTEDMFENLTHRVEMGAQKGTLKDSIKITYENDQLSSMSVNGQVLDVDSLKFEEIKNEASFAPTMVMSGQTADGKIVSININTAIIDANQDGKILNKKDLDGLADGKERDVRAMFEKFGNLAGKTTLSMGESSTVSFKTTTEIEIITTLDIFPKILMGALITL